MELLAKVNSQLRRYSKYLRVINNLEESTNSFVIGSLELNTDTVMVHVRNIREKIEIDRKNPKYLKVVWGAGYKIEKQ